MAYNVLIADDSKTTRRIIAKALQHAGVELGEISEASDGAQALDILEDRWVDLVFADLNMPGMGGVELVQRMAAVDLLSTVPVIIVSTEGRQDRIDALFERGVAAYVRKPFSPEELAQTVHALLETKVADPETDTLAESFYKAVEGFTMLVAEPLESVPTSPERAMVARMRLNGIGVTADVAIAVPEGGCKVIAQTATGEDDGTDGCDALMELLNVTCGQLVDAIAGGPYSMCPPELQELDGASAWAEVCSMHRSLGFDVEGLLMVIGASISAKR